MAYQRHDKDGNPASVSPYVRHDSNNAVSATPANYVRHDTDCAEETTQPTSVAQEDVYGNTFLDFNGDYVSN